MRAGNTVIRAVGLACAALWIAAIGGCVYAARRAPHPTPRLGYAPLLAIVDSGDAEARYHATIALGLHDSRVVRARLHEVLVSEEPLQRNAAARALLTLGDEPAARVLIANLHRDQRTFVVTDAVHHLREVFGTDHGYDPNLGYRHQTEARERWWAWWALRGHARAIDGAHADAETYARLREQLAPRVEAYEALRHGDDPDVWVKTTALWKELAKLAPSRDPRDTALVATAFAGMARRWPDMAEFWNNHALAALNDGRHEEAESSYRRALELAPDDAYLHNDLGILLEGLGRYAEAEALYRAAIRLDPGDDVWRANLGDVLAAQDRRAEAIAAYREAERIAPEKWHYHRLWIRRLRGPKHACR